MARYIDAERLGREVVASWDKDTHKTIEASRVYRQEHIHLMRIIEKQPTAEVAEVKRGKWIKENNKRTCSRCGWHYFSNGVDNNYCSECGARMNGKAEEIKCIDCKHRMFSDMYCECSKGYKGIVQPWDGCEHGQKIEE